MITSDEVRDIIFSNQHEKRNSMATCTNYCAIAEEITEFYAHITGLCDITSAGQVKKGDVIVCKYKGKERSYKVKEVLFPGDHKEEIIVNKKKNKFFLTENVIKGRSWAKNAMFIPMNRGKKHD